MAAHKKYSSKDDPVWLAQYLKSEPHLLREVVLTYLLNGEEVPAEIMTMLEAQEE